MISLYGLSQTRIHGHIWEEGEREEVIQHAIFLGFLPDPERPDPIHAMAYIEGFLGAIKLWTEEPK